MSEPTDRWLVDLHNDVNVRTGKPIVSYAHSRVVHRVVDARSAFVQFLFSIAFTLSDSQAEHFRTFCLLAFPTVGLTPPDVSQFPDRHFPHYLFEYVRPFAFANFNGLVLDFVPPTLYSVYGISADDIRESLVVPPCSNSMCDTALQSLVHEERVDGVNTHRSMVDIARRVLSNTTHERLVARASRMYPLLDIPRIDYSPEDSMVERIQSALQTNQTTASIAGLLMHACMPMPTMERLSAHYLITLGVVLVILGVLVLVYGRHPNHRKTLVFVLLLLLSSEIYLSIMFPWTGLGIILVSTTILFVLGSYRYKTHPRADDDLSIPGVLI